MKKIKSLSVFLCLLTLCACGGGGGGGSGNGGGGGPLNIQHSDLTPSTGAAVDTLASVSTVVDSLADGSTVTNRAPMIRALTGYTVKKTADGIELEVSVNSPDEDRVVSLPATVGSSAFRTESDYVSTYKETVLSGLDYIDSGSGEHIVGTVKHEDKLYFGGNKLGLQYAEFGTWKQTTWFDGTVDGVETHERYRVDSEALEHPFYLVEAGKNAAFSAGIGTQTFTGNALGFAYDYEGSNELEADIFGTARMDVDLANLSSASLELNFQNFYTFGISGVNLTGGTFSKTDHSGASLTVTDNGNTSAVALNTGNMALEQLQGAVAGPNAASPEEIVGKFKIYEKGVDKEVIGAFGMKKRP